MKLLGGKNNWRPKCNVLFPKSDTLNGTSKYIENLKVRQI